MNWKDIKNVTKILLQINVYLSTFYLKNHEPNFNRKYILE